MVTERRFRARGRKTARINRLRAFQQTFLRRREQSIRVIDKDLKVRHGVFIHRRFEQDQRVLASLPFGTDNVLRIPRRHRERNQRGRHMQIKEAAAHRIFAADRADFQFRLRDKRAQKRRDRFAPRRRVA